MSRLTELIAKAKAKDPQFGADLEREFQALSSRLSFGLNFERHKPEAVELPQRPVRRGDKVRMLPPRGSTTKGDQRLWLVKRIVKGGRNKLAELETLDARTEQQTAEMDDLIVVAEFRDTIYPGLVSTGSIARGGDKPWHTVICGENYHALKALTWTHRGKIDAIYIDPPYNSGDRDWKYNNHYVEEDDHYRHSKWLAMMERRLNVAKLLLNPADSVLIVTIDEKEYLRLGLLLEQTFEDARIQMVSSLINPAAVPRTGEFGRSDEYLYFLKFGSAAPRRTQLSREWVSSKGRTHNVVLRWDLLKRSGKKGSRRTDSPGCFYPIYVDPVGPKIVRVGETLAAGVSEAETVDGAYAVLPIRDDGSEGRWQWQPSALRQGILQGRVKVSGSVEKGFTVYILKPGEYRKIEKGEVKVIGNAADGSVVVEGEVDSETVRAIPSTQWRISSHDATQYGTRLLADYFLPKRDFPYPKSLFAVEDALRFFIVDKPKAVVLDFFAGSGTTAHAVMRLNEQDGGNRQCITVTNNEVAADEQAALREKKLRPGDDEWEKWGICDYITKPRVQAAITGKTPDNHPIKGNYQFGKSIKKEKPRSFKHISFVKPAELDTVAKKKQMLALIDSLPQTLATDPCPFIVSDDERHTASVLFNPDATDDWLQALDGQGHITEFFIVTPDKRTFDGIKKQVSDLLGPLIVSEDERSPMAKGLEENAEFFTLTYETPVAVSYQAAFARIAPLLWMRAGSAGRRIEALPTIWGDCFARVFSLVA